MLVTKNRPEARVSFEELWVKLSNKAMGKRGGYHPYEKTGWELIQPLLAAGWHTHKQLRDHAGRTISQTLVTHCKELRKRGKDKRTEYRLK